MRVVLSGGGTGGHVYPALAVAAALREELSARDERLELLYEGIRGRIDEDLMTQELIAFRTVRASPLRVRAPWRLAKGMVDLAVGTLQARRHLRRFRPHVVFATGGYASAPVALAARTLGRPILVYLPDIRPGWAVRMMARLATQVAVTSEASLPHLPSAKTVVTGYPVRQVFAGVAKEEGRRRLGLDPAARTLLVSGGSQGAHSINRMVAENLPGLMGLCQVVHLSGPADLAWLHTVREALPEGTQPRYHVYPYLREEMPWAMAAADLVLSRAGASTLGELPLMGLPSLLVPGPFSDQAENARYLTERGAAVTLTNGHVAGAMTLLTELLQDERRLEAMSQAARALAQPDASRRIARLLIEIAVNNT
ncbi:MAG: UDP-N-acetylglucosamine--N-acetylmuramyl-(pentapeptide) pyrophosphoryl-undecaprenol N-acetylglucosamine transferase [Dehalococcoidia bacterium]